MNKKLGATLIAILMLIGMIPALYAIPPAHAQENEWECGENPWDYPMCVFLHPGLLDIYKPGWSHTLDTYWGTQGGEAQRRQLFDHYLDYAILASASESIGDLQFDITVTETISAIELYVPPEFTFTAPSIEESVWTDLTNDYDFVAISTTSAYDPIAPGWTKIMIGIGWWGSGPDGAAKLGAVIDPKVDIDTGLLVPYHIRLFNVVAPSVAGMYHFKIYYWDTNDATSNVDNPLYWDNIHSIGAGNFPIIIVKQELNPAWVEATVRTELYFNPPLVSGYVVAEGTTPEGRTVKGVAYWGPNDFVQNVFVADMYGNAGAEYHTFLFGLAEGTYDITAYASGAVPKTGARFTVLAGQSYHAYMTVFDSPDIATTVYSKHGTGELPWGNLWQLPFGTNDPYAPPCDDNTPECPRRDILFELYNSDKEMVAFYASNDAVATSHPGPHGPYYYSASARKWFGWANRLDDTHNTIVPGSGAPWPTDASGFPIFGPSPLVPTATFVSFHLTDNYDLLLQIRGYPSTQWDGHVPWDTADYVNGLLNGAYTLEAFVTGYIMDEADAYQRSFVVSGIEKTVPMDLRRSNWIEVQMHMPSGIFLSTDTTVTLTAEDANGGERAAAAFFAPGGTSDIVCAPIGICNVVLEGKNGIYPNFGSSISRGTGAAREPTEKDYGLNPTPSTHSAGAVTLAGNPYTVKLYMADMGEPWAGIEGTGWYNIVGGDPQTSIFLCNSASFLSFTIRPAWLELFIRSVDFQVPAHSRPWTFPGSEIWVDFIDENGDTADVLDPTCYGLIQDAGMTMPGFDIPGVDYAIPEGLEVGYGVSPFDFDNVNAAGHHELLRVKYTGTDWASPGSLCSYSLYRTLATGSGARATHLPPGAYTVDFHTHGYVTRRAFPVQVPLENGADIAADLIQGGQIRVIMSFKHEAIKTLFTGFVRVEVLNEAGELVGASVYGRAEPNTFTDTHDGGGYFALHDPAFFFYDDFYAWNMKFGWDDTLAAFKYPGSVYDPGNDISGATGFGEPYDVFPSASHGQRALYSNLYYGVPNCPDELDVGACEVWAAYDYTTPIDANKFIGGGFSGGHGTDTVMVDVYGFYWYFGDPARTWAGGWPTTNGAWKMDSGIRGSDDIPNWSGSGGGKYSVKIYAFDYERERMYAMGWPLTDITLPWGGAQLFYVDMNSLATLKGTVSWIDMFGNYRALPWAQISVSPGPDSETATTGLSTNTAYTTGFLPGTSGVETAAEWLMWLPAGSHDVMVSTSEAPGVWGGPAELNAQYTVFLNDGAVGGGESRLDHTEGVPVPELPALLVPFGLLAALAASVWLLRKRSLSTPLLMK